MRLGNSYLKLKRFYAEEDMIMTEQKVKLGVVGLKRGKSIALDALGNPDMVLYAICDRDAATMEQAKKEFAEKNVENLLCFSELDDMLQSDIDAVLIATDAPLHAQQAIKALNAGKHVLSEIPTIYSLEDAKALKAAVKAHPELKYMAGENCCYWAFIETWKKMREKGMFGEIVYAEGEYLHSGDPEKFKPAEGEAKNHWRNHLPAIRYLTHQMGPLLYVMDDKCVSVSCMEPIAKYNPNKQQPENGIAIFRTAKGAVIRVFICFGAYVGGGENNYKLYGTRGSIDTGVKNDYTHGYSYAKLADIPGTLYKKMEIPVGYKYIGEQASGHGGADGKMVRDFIRCIIEDTEPVLNVDFGIRMSLPGIIAHESALQGGALMEIPEIE